MSPLRVLVVAPWGERAGGAEEMLSTLLRHLDRSVVEPEVVFLGDGQFVREVVGLGIPVWVMPSGRLRDVHRFVRTIARLARLMREREPDVVLAWSAKAHLYAGGAAVIAGRRSMWWQHMIPDGHWLDRLATVVPASAIGCSSQACAHGQKRLWPRRRTFVVYPGVELRQPDRSLTREQFGIPADATVVGIVGRLQPWKGQDRVIRAVAELRNEGVPAFALVVGGAAFGLSKDYASGLRRLAHDLDVEGHVCFTGQVGDAWPYYSLMDVFVSASEMEPFGIVIVEAMAAGIPVVAKASGGAAEIVTNGLTGLAVEHEDLTSALRRLTQDPVLTRSLVAAGSHVAIRFAAAASARAFAEIVSVSLERSRQ